MTTSSTPPRDAGRVRAGPLRRLYDWTLRLAEHPHALWALAGISFIESSIFPVPPDILLIAIVLARPERWFTAALVCTLASVAGGLAGYALGALVFEAVGQPILAFYGYLDRFADFSALYGEHGWWIVFGAGLTPIPYKVITIASGAAHLDLVVFTVASVVARGLRFFAEALLLWRFGRPMRRLIERYFGLATVLVLVLTIGGFVLLKGLAGG